MMDSEIKNKAELLLVLLYAGISDKLGEQNSVEIEGITRLEKLLFLLKKQKGFLSNVPPEDDFKFFPFKMGPWTNEVYDEIDFLESLGLLKKEEDGDDSPADSAYFDELLSNSILDKYQKSEFSLNNLTEIFTLTEDGKTKALNIWNRLPNNKKESIIELKRNFGRMNLKQFLRYVYKNYPEYTTKSEIKESLGLTD